MYLLSYIKECQRSLQLLKNKILDQFEKRVITIISIISSKKKNNFWSRYFWRVVIFGGSLLWAFANPGGSLLLAFTNSYEILSLLLKGRYFKGVVTLGTLQ